MSHYSSDYFFYLSDSVFDLFLAQDTLWTADGGPTADDGADGLPWDAAY